MAEEATGAGPVHVAELKGIAFREWNLMAHHYHHRYRMRNGATRIDQLVIWIVIARRMRVLAMIRFKIDSTVVVE